MRLFGTQYLDKRLPWEPSLPSVAVTVETDSLRLPRGPVLAGLAVVAVCTLSLALLALRAKEMLEVELTRVISSHPVVVVARVARVAMLHQRLVEMVARA
jgi:hypothetical protein